MVADKCFEELSMRFSLLKSALSSSDSPSDPLVLDFPIANKQATQNFDSSINCALCDCGAIRSDLRFVVRVGICPAVIK